MTERTRPARTKPPPPEEPQEEQEFKRWPPGGYHANPPKTCAKRKWIRFPDEPVWVDAVICKFHCDQEECYLYQKSRRPTRKQQWEDRQVEQERKLRKEQEEKRCQERPSRSKSYSS